MYPRTNYEMTEADLEKILNACKPTPAMFLSGGVPIGGTPQENANRAWAELGSRMGFDYMTVQPTGRGTRFFTAVPSEINEQRVARLAREAEAKRLEEIVSLQNEIAKRQARLDKLIWIGWKDAATERERRERILKND